MTGLCTCTQRREDQRFLLGLCSPPGQLLINCTTFTLRKVQSWIIVALGLVVRDSCKDYWRHKFRRFLNLLKTRLPQPGGSDLANNGTFNKTGRHAKKWTRECLKKHKLNVQPSLGITTENMLCELKTRINRDKPKKMKQLSVLCVGWSASNLVRHYRKRLCAVIFSTAGGAFIHCKGADNFQVSVLYRNKWQH